MESVYTKRSQRAVILCCWWIINFIFVVKPNEGVCNRFIPQQYRQQYYSAFNDE
jgi:hypothetical protein